MREGRVFRPAVDAPPFCPLVPRLAQLAAASCARRGTWERLIRPSYGGTEAPPFQLLGKKSSLTTPALRATPPESGGELRYPRADQPIHRRTHQHQWLHR